MAGITAFTFDRQTFTATASAGGVATFNIPCSTADSIYRLMVRCYSPNPSGGHLNASGAWVGEYVVQNKNGTVTAIAAVASSANPDNFAGLVTVRPEVGDASVATTTGVWTVSTPNAVLTVTVQAGSGPLANALVGIVVDYEIIGAT